MNAKKQAASRWVRDLLVAHGVTVIRWEDHEFGLVNVPKKWAAIISDLATALQLAAAGEPLPTLRPQEPKKKRAQP